MSEQGEGFTAGIASVYFGRFNARVHLEAAFMAMGLHRNA